MDEIFYQSPIGALKIRANQSGIRSIEFVDESEYPSQTTQLSQNRAIKSIVKELDLYFEGSLRKFKTPLDSEGTEFQKNVWNELSKISAGSTTYYGAIAKNIGNPKAARAVGLANNRNPLPIVVPCHRVVGKSGSLVGYAGKLWRKKWLLDHERAFA